VVIAAGLAGDLLSKHYVFESMLADPSLRPRLEELLDGYGRERPGMNKVLADLRIQRQVIPGVRLTLSTNPGVVFGIAMPGPLVAVATVVTVVLVVCFFATSPARAHWSHVGLAFIVAGALGNLYDRLFSEVALPGLEPISHQVRDFIDCSQIGYKWIFNAADAYLVVGVAMLIAQWLQDGLKARKARASKGKS